VAAAAVPLVTVLAPTAKYVDNLTAPWSAERVTRDGVIAYPMPAQAPDLWLAIDDVAAAIATAIERAVPGRFALPGAALTGDQVAEAVADGLGRPVRWEAMAPRDWAELVRPHLGDHAADGTAAVYEMGLPPAPAPDPGPARDALGWAAPDVAAWARSARWPVPVA
jgi:nucleoside-diphosphate-sugar epimerase